MSNMDIDRIVDDIEESEERRREAAEELRDEAAGKDFTGMEEGSFIQEVDAELPAEFTATGVDGGLVRKELHGVDLIMRRAVAAVFSYEDRKATGADYRPERSPPVDVEHVTSGLDRQQVHRLASLLRLHSEVTAASEAVEETDLLLMDGSLLPQMRDRPDTESELYDRYENLLEKYRELYSSAEENGTLVAGVVEDSRGSRMCNVLRESSLGGNVEEGERDTVLLSHILEHGERTMAVPYSESNAPVLQDVGLGDSFRVMYLKTVEKDRPVRVEFYSPGDTAPRAEEVASRVAALCGDGSSYGIPPVLVEADQRAALDGDAADLLTGRIRARLAHLPGTEELRRERRPF